MTGEGWPSLRVPDPGPSTRLIPVCGLPSAVQALCQRDSVIKIRNESPLIGYCTQSPKNDGKAAYFCHGVNPKVITRILH